MAYTTATILDANVNGDGSSTLVVGFSGDANEAVVQDKLAIAFATTPDPDYVRRYAINKLAGLNATKTFYAGKVAKGVIDTTPLSAPVVDAARQDWQDKHLLYVAAQKAVAFGYEPQSTLDAAKADALKAYTPAYLIYLRNA